MTDILYKFYPSGENLLLILTGIGGTVDGANGKYKIIAENAVKNHGFSVLVAATPHGVWQSAEEYFKKLTDLLRFEMPNGAGEIYALGNSAGATLLLWYSRLVPQIKKVLAVNPVLNINMHRANDGIKGFNGEKIFVAVGEKDASFSFSEGLTKTDKCERLIVKNADHNFTGETDAFIELSERCFFENFT